MSRKQIWMNPPLKLLAEKSEGKGRDGTFSRRLGDIVERYEVMLKLTPAIELSDTEKMIIGEVVCGSVINPTTIRHMPESIMDCATGSIEERTVLREKVAKLSPAERIALIESLGL
ncbi:hypothetical protein M7775_07765 [Sporomusa sphaeroides DSM 2875]|uniref:hypothetical protein n=1 Tax=Sporomusa sphaeroides TaxID=47679 RepID=UPI00202DF76E|nr:hypothetical protein [Sporomusa sphaeroides]MCM0758469.1 hypothetical protein [Sporomusa sphaeroides DSM 2875]